jgi:hypothetical protein
MFRLDPESLIDKTHLAVDETYRGRARIFLNRRVTSYPTVVQMTAFLYTLFMMCLDVLYPAGAAMSVAACRRVYARIRNGWYLSICSPLHRDLHSRFPRGLEEKQTQIVSVED